jgi:hypothetical protein
LSGDPSLTLFEIAHFSREATTAHSCGLTPTAMRCRRFAAEVRNFKTDASGNPVASIDAELGELRPDPSYPLDLS